jgi:hypothetical protein
MELKAEFWLCSIASLTILAASIAVCFKRKSEQANWNP